MDNLIIQIVIGAFTIGGVYASVKLNIQTLTKEMDRIGKFLEDHEQHDNQRFHDMTKWIMESRKL